MLVIRRLLRRGGGPGHAVRGLVLALVAGTAVLLLPAAAAQAATAQFTPGQAWTDTGGRALQMHGLGIVKAGSTWYGFGEDKSGESASTAAFQDIPCYSSTDLSHWTRQGIALARQASGDLGPNRVVERPKVIRNAATGTYVMYLHIDDPGYSEAKVGVAVSTSACGPYAYRGSFRPGGFQSRDIGLFQEADGTAYLLTEDRANGLRIDRLSADYLSVAGTVALLPDYESPAMVRAGGTYYLLASRLTGWSTNDNVYATAPSPAGPWSAFRNFAPAGTNTYDTQTANVVPVTGTAGTTYVYAGDRWNPSDLGSSPMVWLPLTLSGTTADVGWQNAWSLETATGTWSGSSDPATGTPRRLTNSRSALVLDISDGSTADGGRAIQWTDHGGANQQWTLTRLTGNAYTLRNANSGLCLEVPDGSTTAGTQLDQWTCNGGTNQSWAFDAVGAYTSSTDATYRLTNLNSGLVADVADNSTSPGGTVDQWPTNGGANQAWTVS